MTYRRKKGSAIVDTRKGILVVASRSRHYMLPGGGADKGESRKRAAIRELREETGLKTKSARFFYAYLGGKWYNRHGPLRNDTKVFVVRTYGHARPRHEIKHIAYWKPGSSLRISQGTKAILMKYLGSKKQ